MISIKQALDSYALSVKSTDLKRVETSFESLSDDDQEWLKRVHEKLGINKTLVESMTQAVAVNQNFLNSIGETFDPSEVDDMPSTLEARVRILPWVVAREWGSEPEEVPERNAVYGPILDALNQFIPNLESAEILVPGSACGRLVYDIASMGVRSVVGVDLDSIKTRTAQHIFKGNRFPIQPFVLETCNREKASDNIRELIVPDIEIDKSVLTRIKLFSKEFLDYSNSIATPSFDGIATAFFLDTTSNTHSYVSEFARLLPSGGIWINCGPLQYHYGSEKMVINRGEHRELNKEELFQLVKKAGFEILQENLIETEYLGNPRSLMSTKIKCLFFIARKV